MLLMHIKVTMDEYEYNLVDMLKTNWLSEFDEMGSHGVYDFRMNHINFRVQGQKRCTRMLCFYMLCYAGVTGKTTVQGFVQ